MEQSDCQKMSGREIVKRVIADPEFYSCIIQTYEERLRSYIRRLTNVHPDEVDDILQEVFIKAYENINSYDKDYQFSTWLYRIARNETISYWRKHKKRFNDQSLDIGDDFLDTLRSDVNLNVQIDNQLLREKMNLVLQKMPIKYREVVVLYYFEEHNYQEISDILKKPISTVGTLLKRAKQQLKDLII
ncbi:MAG: RNA polymerase sigma factor [Candidatus Komeilibacteria bacterium]